MRIRKINLQSNKGTVLVMVIVMITMMAMIGLAMVSVTFSTFQSAMANADQNVSYFGSEAGVERVMSRLDYRVGELQESAKASASDYFSTRLDTYRNPDGSFNRGAYEVAYLGAEGTAGSFLDYFNTEVDTYFSDVASSLAKQQDLLETADSEGGKAIFYIDAPTNQKSVILDSCSYDDATNRLTATIISEYNDYPKTLEVVFNIQPASLQSVFKPVESTRSKVVMTPDILNKALVTEKNVLVNEGAVNITGNVLAFGTIPSDGTTETQSAQSDEYGGVLLGMNDSLYGNPAVGDGHLTDLELDAERGGKILNDKIADLTVTGNIATMGYISILKSSTGTPSELVVTGDTFARSIYTSTDADYSEATLDDVFITDSMSIDSNQSDITLNGKLYGFVEHGYDIDGVGGAGEDASDYQNPKRTSNVLVTGDSTVTFNDEMFIGGSSFFTVLEDATPSGNPYMSGLSAIKATGNLISAFLKDDVSHNNKVYIAGTPTDPAWDTYYDNSVGPADEYDMMDGTGAGGNFTIQQRGSHFKDTWNRRWKARLSENSENLTVDSSVGSTITITETLTANDQLDIIGKYIWVNDELYTVASATANTITVSESFSDTPSGAISPFEDFENNVAFDNIKVPSLNGASVKGYANGAVTLRVNETTDDVYDSDDFDHSQALFAANEKRYAAWSFYDQIKGLLGEAFSISAPKLNYVSPTKTLDHPAYRNTSYVGVGKIESGSFYEITGSEAKGFVYYDSTGNDIVLEYDNAVDGRWELDGVEIPASMKGVIVSDGNIYIENEAAPNSLSFTGVIMSRKNIVFYGSGESTITYENLVGANKLIDTTSGDLNINGFFGLLPTELSDITDVSKKNQRKTEKTVTIHSIRQTSY